MTETGERSLAALAASTCAVYERNAARFDDERSRQLRERPWLDRFLGLTNPGGVVLDLGCGTGDPIAAYIMTRGFRVIGVDASPAMIELARTRYPAGDWRVGDMRCLDLSERFDAVLGWNSFFHLTPAEQRATLPRLAAHMNPGATLMLTVGPGAGEVAGQVGGELVYHGSLSPLEYEAHLARLGLGVEQFVKADPSCDWHTVLLARHSCAPVE